MTARPVIPHVREFLADDLTPLSAYRRLSRLSPVRFLFESVTGGERISRFSFLGAEPSEICSLFADRLEIEAGGEVRVLRSGAPLEDLRRLLGEERCEPGSVPFTGGFVGYFGYDVVRLCERLPIASTGAESPLAVLARFDTVVVFDHAHQRVQIIANEVVGRVDRAEAERRLERHSRCLQGGGGAGVVPVPESRPGSDLPPNASLGSTQFRAAVESARSLIRNGDIFQVVLARRWRLAREIEPLNLYRSLRLIDPSPYMVLLETPATALVGASPEMLVRKTGSLLETRPIAGTRRRGRSAREDSDLAAELLADPKERAEHVMLVDLGRNDLGRVARPGSVRVASFMEVERYSHVMHLVSSVEGEIAPDLEPLDVLLACFPAGTVSGAPKIRAMEIVDELEGPGRGPYAGAVGYFSYSGDLDTCITIRTLVVEDGEISITAGAGIVADSDPALEEAETENKAAAVAAAVAMARALEATE